jgi:hypothetical protein
LYRRSSRCGASSPHSAEILGNSGPYRPLDSPKLKRDLVGEQDGWLRRMLPHEDDARRRFQAKAAGVRDIVTVDLQVNSE